MSLLFRCVLLVVKLLRLNRKGPAQIAQMRNLSWAFTVSYLPFSHIEYQWTKIKFQMNINHENIEKLTIIGLISECQGTLTREDFRAPGCRRMLKSYVPTIKRLLSWTAALSFDLIPSGHTKIK